MSEQNKAILENDIILKDADGTAVHYSYSDVWRFRGDKIIELRAFVIKT